MRLKSLVASPGSFSGALSGSKKATMSMSLE
jgi:hypothetical protein